MTPRQVINKARNKLGENYELNAILLDTGEVRIPVISDIIATSAYSKEAIPTNTTCDYVTFTTGFDGFVHWLVADFNGYKEFVYD